MITLSPGQKKAVRVIHRIWRDWDGAILRADEGTGKTIMATAACAGGKILFVAPARALKGLRKKIDSYCILKDSASDCRLISYHGFADYEKLTNEELKTFDFIVFDECHNLKKFSAGWTTRFVRIRPQGKKFLFLSATPMTKGPKDYMYVIKKTGVFGNTPMPDLYQHYFDAKQSKYGDFLEFGPLQNKDCFQAHLDKIVYDIKIEDADPEIPSPVFGCHFVSGTAWEISDFEKATETALHNEINKVPDAVTYIKRDRKKHKITMTLCKFHETAKEIHRDLGGILMLSNKNMQEVMDELASSGGHLITTLGLTDCNFDFNACNRIYMVGNTYSALLDRQSIRRCYRRGKREVLNVTYFLYKSDPQFHLAASRAYLERNLSGHSKMGPSSLKRLEQCPGSYWLPPIDNVYEAAAYFGTKAHESFERYVQNDQAVPGAYSAALKDAILKARLYRDKSTAYGVEERVHLDNVHKDMWGTCDFWCLNGSVLNVFDYKNGVAKVSDEDNLQLLAYAAMVAHTKKIEPARVTVGILQGGELRTQEYGPEILGQTEERIKRIIAAIMAAKDEPLKHLNKGKCDFFCPAKHIHESQKEVKVSKPSFKRVPRYSVEGRVFWQQSTGERFTIGLNAKELPKEEFKKNLSEGEYEALKASLAKANERNKVQGTATLFLSSKEAWLPTGTSNQDYKGSTVKADITVSVKGEQAYLNLKGVEVLKAAEQKAEMGEDLL